MAERVSRVFPVKIYGLEVKADGSVPANPMHTEGSNAICFMVEGKAVFFNLQSLSVTDEFAKTAEKAILDFEASDVTAGDVPDSVLPPAEKSGS